MKQTQAFYVVAIDGPMGVGKSSAARELAKKLGLYFLSSGMIYRAMAWFLTQDGWQGMDVPDSQTLGKLENLNVEVNEAGDVFVGGEQVTDALRAEEIGQATSRISVIQLVRTRSNQVQRETVKSIQASGSFSGVVLEGRDVGTVVFPDASHKFFLNADEEVRAGRRFEELRRKGEDITFEAVLKELKERDHRDRTREVAPLIPAKDAIEVDSTKLDLEGVVSVMADQIKNS